MRESVAKMFELRLKALHEHHMLEIEKVKLQHDIKLEQAAEAVRIFQTFANVCFHLRWIKFA